MEAERNEPVCGEQDGGGDQGVEQAGESVAFAARTFADHVHFARVPRLVSTVEPHFAPLVLFGAATTATTAPGAAPAHAPCQLHGLPRPAPVLHVILPCLLLAARGTWATERCVNSLLMYTL